MPLIIENASLLLGSDLEHIARGFIFIENNGIITDVGKIPEISKATSSKESIKRLNDNEIVAYNKFSKASKSALKVSMEEIIDTNRYSSDSYDQRHPYKLIFDFQKYVSVNQITNNPNLQGRNSAGLQTGEKTTKLSKEISYQANKSIVIDASNYLIIPAFINAHTHIADTIAKDIGAGLGLDNRVNPVFGIKRKILNNSRPEHLKALIRSSAISMMKKGISVFADFREGGIEGVRLLEEALSDLPIKYLALGRVEYYQSPESKMSFDKGMTEQVAKLIGISDGLGISGANENTDAMLEGYRKIFNSQERKSDKIGDKNQSKKQKAIKNDRNTYSQNANESSINKAFKSKKLVAIHAAESKETLQYSISNTGKTEIERAVFHLKPDFIVHMTHGTDKDIKIVAKNKIGIVICPRANGVLGAGIPPMAKMLKNGCTVALGTDNIMLNSPDVFREMDYIWKASRANEADQEFLHPKEVLKAATVSGAAILGCNSGQIFPGKSADLLFIDKNRLDLFPMHDPYASIVHRADAHSIAAMMIEGRFIKYV